MTRKIEVVPHDPDWSRQFEQAADQLRDVFGEQVVGIHHVGSTAIPGIAAKPIIDVLVEVRDIEKVDDFDEAVIEQGYLPKGEFGIPGRRFFIKGDEERRTHHIHVFQAGDPEFERHLTFRDYMITHPKQAKAYGQLKQKLARKFPHDVEGYMAGKEAFIEAMERKALAWKGR